MKLPFAIAAAFATVALAGPALAGPAEDIIAKEKCSKCHTATTTKKAPSWASVAEKYKGKPDADRRSSSTCSRPAARTTTTRLPPATPI